MKRKPIHFETEKTIILDQRTVRNKGSLQELAYKITDEQQVFMSESSVYRILKARGLITAPAHIFVSAADEFTSKTGFVHLYAL
ncbi:helix-turn-helix domain-containing protein [Pricia sp.]|uniref:helix-turn-helix domain-containing protein n=1 Tax=Pricia sp. TaxID=2268138 RepID=UPI0035941229